MRAISTVVDVTVCLLLLSGAVVALTLPVAEQPPDRDVDEIATVVGTATTNVSYQLAGEQLTPAATDATAALAYGERHRDGTVAGLLARAAITNATLDGDRLVPEASDYRDAVREKTRAVIPARVSVTARWEPYPNANLSGVVTVGDTPPATADIQTATLSVPVTGFAVDDDLERIDSYEAVARPTARAIVAGTLPDSYGEAATGDDLAVRSVSHRAQVLAGNESLPATQYQFAGDVSGLHDRVTAALADRLATDLQSEFETPSEAASAVSPGRVTVTVRGWTQ